MYGMYIMYQIVYCRDSFTAIDYIQFLAPRSLLKASNKNVKKILKKLS